MKLPRNPDRGQSSERVFRKLYRVRVPRSMTLSKAEIELYGQRMTGIKNLDKYLANEMITGRIPTTWMANIIHDGGMIQFCNPEDVKQCYLDLFQHILNWKFLLETRYNINPPPQDDFEKLQGLLTALEAYAGVLDRDTNANTVAPLNILTGGNAYRKVTPTRIPLMDVPDPHVQVTEIHDYDELLRMSRR